MTVDVTKYDFELLADDQVLASRIERWLSEPYLAIDTEFMRESTYYAIPGLIQIADQHGVDLIDPLQVTDLSVLRPVLENPNVVKIMHSMSEDIELLYHLTGAAPQCVFDTQTAAAFLGYGASLGYQDLVAKVLAIELDKSETRSDWLQRPLSDKQLAYAAKDAVYLVALYQALRPLLEAKAYLDAVFEESQFLIEQSIESWQESDQAYLKIRGAWDLPLARQQLLRHLVIWRDQLARQQNVPKSWVFSDYCLIRIAQNVPETNNDLKRIEKVKFKSLRLYGDQLMEQLSTFEPGPADSFVPVDRPIKNEEMQAYKKLKKIVEQVSEESGIVSQLLGSRKMLERIVIHCLRMKKSDLPPEFMGWRWALLGERFSLTMQEYQAY